MSICIYTYVGYARLQVRLLETQPTKLGSWQGKKKHKNIYSNSKWPLHSLKQTVRHWQWGPPGKGDSYWKPPFSGALLVSGRVHTPKINKTTKDPTSKCFNGLMTNPFDTSLLWSLEISIQSVADQIFIPPRFWLLLVIELDTNLGMTKWQDRKSKTGENYIHLYTQRIANWLLRYQIYVYIYTHISTYNMYIYIYVCVYVYLYKYVCCFFFLHHQRIY